MTIRLAQKEDLPRLKEAYRTVVARMVREGIDIWNERYPYEVLGEDIERKRLYLMEDEEKIEAVFALLAESGGADRIDWRYGGRALYLYRLGVAGTPRTGLGEKAVQSAIALAAQQGAQTLRLFVVDSNAPALAFYRKCGFEQAPGVYVDSVADGPLLREYGFEKPLAGR